MNLVVLMESDINRTLPKRLSLHIDSILADQSITTFASSHAALTRSFSIILGMRGEKFAWVMRFGHFPCNSVYCNDIFLFLKEKSESYKAKGKARFDACEQQQPYRIEINTEKPWTKGS